MRISRQFEQSQHTSETRRKITSVILSIDVFAISAISWYLGSFPGSIGTIAEADVYGLLAAATLYLTLFISPLVDALPRFAFRQEIFLARRGLGLSSLVFAVSHVLVSFFGPIGSWSGLAFVEPMTGVALFLGFGALVILVILGSTAWDGAVRILGIVCWKKLHRWIYLAGLLILTHLLMVGPHFVDRKAWWVDFIWILAIVLFALEAARFDRWLRKKNPNARQAGPIIVFLILLLTVATNWFVRQSVWALWAIGMAIIIFAFPVVLFDRWFVTRFPGVRRFGPGSVIAVIVITSILSGLLSPFPSPHDELHQHSNAPNSEASP